VRKTYDSEEKWKVGLELLEAVQVEDMTVVMQIEAEIEAEIEIEIETEIETETEIEIEIEIEKGGGHVVGIDIVDEGVLDPETVVQERGPADPTDQDLHQGEGIGAQDLVVTPGESIEGGLIQEVDLEMDTVNNQDQDLDLAQMTKELKVKRELSHQKKKLACKLNFC